MKFQDFRNQNRIVLAKVFEEMVLWHQGPRYNGTPPKMVLALEVITYLNQVRVQHLKYAQLDEQWIP